MKLNKLIGLCKKSRIIEIFESGDTQFVGDGSCFYALHKMPTLTEDVIYSVFDIEENAKNKFYYHEFEEPPLNVNDCVEFEKLVDVENIGIQQNDSIYLPIKTSVGLLFIRAKQLNPILDTCDYELYERKNASGLTYFVIKVGLLVVAAIMPVSFVSEELIKQLDELSFECQRTLSQKGEVVTDD